MEQSGNANAEAEAAEDESFPELEAALTAAIEALGGAVCPKLNWSVPRDAMWVNGGTLRCETAGDVMLLLKSSDFVQHDLERMCVEVDDTVGAALTTDAALAG